MESRVGQQLGHYRLLRLLGQGAFADVYLAENLELNLMVAIKILQRRLVGEADLESFRREAQTIAQLRHPNIVQIFDFDLQDGSPLLIMEYAPGGSLRHRHPEGTQLLPAHVVPYVQQAAKALHYAHSQRLIHRDVKPENMLLGPNNEVLLSDFGLVQMVKSSSKQSTKEMAGTVLYMAPEQIQGKPRPASDQYALGAMTYEWLTGEPPFQGSFTEIATQHLFATPLPLCSKVPQISPALERVVLRSLAKEPQQRFADIEEFALAVKQASQPTASASFDDARDPCISPDDEAYISTFVKQPSEPNVLQFPPLIPHGVSPSTQFVSADDAETRINSPSRTASPGLSSLQSSQDPLLDLSTVDMSKQDESEMAYPCM